MDGREPERNVAGINSLGATSLTGTLLTLAQPNITSIGTLSSLNLLGAGITHTQSAGGNVASFTNSAAVSTLTIGIASAGGACDIRSTTANDLYLGANNTRRLSIKSGGNVDINTSSPGYQLDVSGSFNSTSFYMNGTLITASATDLNGVTGYGTYRSGITPGSVAASKAMVTNANSMIQFGSGSATTNQIKYFASTSLRDSIRVYRVDDSSPLTIGGVSATSADLFNISWNDKSAVGFISQTHRFCFNIGNSQPYKSGDPHTYTLATSADAFAVNVASSTHTPTSACLYLVSDTINKMMFNSNTPYSSCYGTAPVTLNQGNVYIKCSNALNDGSSNYDMPIYMESSNASPIGFGLQLNNATSATSTNSSYFGTITTNDLVLMTANTRRVTMSSAGRVGIGTGSHSATLDVSGTVSNTFNVGGSLYSQTTSTASTFSQLGPVTVSVSAMFSGPIQCSSIYCTSDRRAKENIKQLDESYCENFFKADVFTYNCIGSEETIPNIGFIAQDLNRLGYMNLLTLTPNENMKKENDDDIEGAQMNIDYNKITVINFMMIKKLKKRIEELEAKMGQLI
ncbi:hypothetical protein F443_01301 [Phytophthora nicotianae P1569]|uniref:Peptidase S74 domain-containing protein n=3 Tax=Phytophthora nicotianae TaxID=4792 RepID=V9G0C5_PHYNI|nr:hypothetical protein F443_01301 [Phytophthora nicotianae P1569]